MRGLKCISNKRIIKLIIEKTIANSLINEEILNFEWIRKNKLMKNWKIKNTFKWINNWMSKEKSGADCKNILKSQNFSQNLSLDWNFDTRSL